MALRQLGEGLVIGGKPHVQERAGERKAEKELERKLKQLEGAGNLELAFKKLELKQKIDSLKAGGLDPEMASLFGAEPRLIGQLGQTPRGKADIGRMEALSSLYGAREEQVGKLKLPPGFENVEGWQKEQQRKAGLDLRRVEALEKGKDVEPGYLKYMMNFLVKELNNVKPRKIGTEYGQLPGDEEKEKVIRDELRKLSELTGFPMPEYPEQEELTEVPRPHWTSKIPGVKTATEKKWNRVREQIRKDTGKEPTDEQVEWFLRKYKDF